MAKKPTQEDIVLREMKANNGITSMDGLRLGVAHIPSVIRNLKKRYTIESVWVTNKVSHKTYKVYYLA